VNWIGDLERAFATNLYPLRVPIAIALLAAFVVAAYIARRRGWFAAARRHPARTTVLAIAILAIGVPVGWYLGSPLFIRTALVEPAPIATGAAPSAPAASAPALIAPLAGTFTGADDFHFGSGTARLIEASPGAWIVRFEDFSVRNGPDLYVYLSPDPAGYADGVVELGALKATDGTYNMDVPAGTDVSGVHSVVIWCKQFAVQFAVAPLG